MTVHYHKLRATWKINEILEPMPFARHQKERPVYRAAESGKKQLSQELPFFESFESAVLARSSPLSFYATACALSQALSRPLQTKPRCEGREDPVTTRSSYQRCGSRLGTGGVLPASNENCISIGTFRSIDGCIIVLFWQLIPQHRSLAIHCQSVRITSDDRTAGQARQGSVLSSNSQSYAVFVPRHAHITAANFHDFEVFEVCRLGPQLRSRVHQCASHAETMRDLSPPLAKAGAERLGRGQATPEESCPELHPKLLPDLAKN